MAKIYQTKNHYLVYIANVLQYKTEKLQQAVNFLAGKEFILKIRG